MKKKYVIAALMSACMATAYAKGDISVKTEVNASRSDCVDIIVSMTNAENEIRGLECQFTLPEELTVVGIPSYNENRFDGFIPTLDIRNHDDDDSLSKVTFMSLGGNYVAETGGEVFRFTVKVDDEALNIPDFEIYSEITYDNKVRGYDVDKVSIANASPYTVTAATSNIAIENLEEAATVTLAIDNEVAVGGLEFAVELPEGLEFVTKNGKVDWSFSKRVVSTKAVSENALSSNKVKIMVIDAMSGNLINAGEGDVVSFKVKGSMNLAIDSKITVSSIKVSKTNGKQFNQEEVVEVNVKNVLREQANAERLSANEANYNADVETLNTLKGELEEVEEECGEYVNSNDVAALKNELEQLLQEAGAAYNASFPEGNVYNTLVDDAKKAALQSSLQTIAENAKKAQEEAQEGNVKRGDVNVDGKVNMVDLTTLVNIVLKKTAMPEQGTDRYIAADANGDGTIDIVDYTAILNIILGKTNSAAKAPALYSGNESLGYMIDGNLLYINLDNTTDFSAMQFDVVLPAHVAVLSVENTMRTENMEIAYNSLADGTTRVAIVSSELDTITGTTGNIVVLRLSDTVTSGISLDKMIAADAAARKYVLAGNQTTNIEVQKQEGNVINSVYDLTGRQVNSLQKGVNIIRRANGTTTKVIKK